MTTWFIRVLAVLALVSMNAVAESLEDQIAERIKPVGSVCVQGEDCGDVAVASAAPAGGGEPRAAEDIYNTACAACHTSGAGGAPVNGDVAAWTDRIAKGNDTLYDHVINGFNAMPAKGLCMDCSDDELKATVDYMVGQNQ